MMKKIIKIALFSLTIGLPVAFFGCASTNIAINEYESIAIVSLTGNKNLSEQVDTTLVRSDEEDVDDTNVLSVLVDKFLHGENPELQTGQDRVDYAEEYFHHAFEEIAGLKVASKDEVANSSVYTASYKSPFSIMDTWIGATGLEKNLYSIGAKNARLLMQELNVNSLVTAEFRFNKVLDDESKVKTKVHAQVVMDVIFYDEKGSKRLMKQYKAEADEKLPVVKFKYDTEALVAQYPQVIETVINKFVVENMQ